MKKKNLLLIIFMAASMGLFAQSMPLNWYLDEVNPGIDISLFIEEEAFTQGTRSCHARMNNDEVPYLISDDFAVNAGASYTFSMDFLDNDANGLLKFYCDFRDIDGGDIWGEDPIEVETDSPDWRTVEWTGVVPAEAVVGYVLVKFYTQEAAFTDTAHMWLDNTQFVEDGQSNAVINGGFEDWTLQVPDKPTMARDIEVYPNPATDHIQILNTERVDRIIISDLTGKKIMDRQVSGKQKIDLGETTQGVYIVTMMEGERFIRNTKLVVK